MRRKKNILYPDRYEESAYSVDYSLLYADGVRGLIFDIDNTIVPDNALADDRVITLFRRLEKMGFKLCIVSNNQQRRVEPFAIATGSVYICDAAKPNVRGYKRAIRLMRMPRKKIVAIGDQIFTDVVGANLAGIYSILVKPLDPDERFHIRLKRLLERVIIRRYLKKTVESL